MIRTCLVWQVIDLIVPDRITAMASKIGQAVEGAGEGSWESLFNVTVPLVDTSICKGADTIGHIPDEMMSVATSPNGSSAALGHVAGQAANGLLALPGPRVQTHAAAKSAAKA